MENQPEKLNVPDDYSRTITSLIKKNHEFLSSHQEIRWYFVWNDDISIYGASTSIGLAINKKAAITSIQEGNKLELEYFLMHEIRHCFQKEVIDDYKKTGKSVVDSAIVEQWIKEKSHYQSAKNPDGSVNEAYFAQDCEMDAYAYSFAIMKYKYGSKANKLYLPESYKTSKVFQTILEGWLQTFCHREIRKL